MEEGGEEEEEEGDDEDEDEEVEKKGRGKRRKRTIGVRECKNPEYVCMSAIFLAGKAEETRVKLSDILPIFRKLWKGEEGEEGEGGGAEELCPLSKRYYLVRERVLFYEKLHLQVRRVGRGKREGKRKLTLLFLQKKYTKTYTTLNKNIPLLSSVLLLVLLFLFLPSFSKTHRQLSLIFSSNMDINMYYG